VRLTHLEIHLGCLTQLGLTERRIEERMANALPPCRRRNREVCDLPFVRDKPRHNITHNAVVATTRDHEENRWMRKRLTKRSLGPRIAKRLWSNGGNRRNILGSCRDDRHCHPIGNGRPCVVSHFTCASARRPYDGSHDERSAEPRSERRR